MSNALFDQTAWLRRIGYEGSLAPTLETLRGLVHCHSRVERRVLETEDDFKGVLRGELGLSMPDGDIRACLAIVAERGTRGPPHPFFS